MCHVAETQIGGYETNEKNIIIKRIIKKIAACLAHHDLREKWRKKTCVVANRNEISKH